MEGRKNSVQDKIAMFNQITAVGSKNENISNKPPIPFNKSNLLLEKKFPELANLKKEEKNKNLQKDNKQISKKEENIKGADLNQEKEEEKKEIDDNYEEKKEYF